MLHHSSSPLAGTTVKIVKGEHAGSEYRVEDWWDRIAGKSWMFCAGNPACINYAVRAAVDSLPMNDHVVYGKIGSLGHLVHVSEIESVEAR